MQLLAAQKKKKKIWFLEGSKIREIEKLNLERDWKGGDGASMESITARMGLFIN